MEDLDQTDSSGRIYPSYNRDQDGEAEGVGVGLGADLCSVRSIWRAIRLQT